MAKAKRRVAAKKKEPVKKSATVDTNLLNDLLRWAKAAGADAADAYVAESAQLSVGVRLGVREKLERSESQDLSLRVFIGKRMAIVASTDFDPAGLKALAERAVAMARVVPEDPYCGLAPADRIARGWPELDLDDGKEASVALLQDWCDRAEDAARAVKGVTNSEGANAGWSRGRVALAASNGFAGEYRYGSYGVDVSVLAGEGVGMERDYDWSQAVYVDDLDQPEVLGRNAGRGAVKRLNPRKIKSGRYPVIYDRRISGGLLGHLASAINGRGIARKTSFLLDKLGKRVFSKGLRVVDDPHRKRRSGSRPFDGEGLPTKRMNLIEDGKLTTWLLDLNSARQLGLEPTGHGAWGGGPTTSNLYLEKGKERVKSLIAGIKRGLYVTDLIGFGVNGVTGDYSRGASGFWIEKGELAWPVSGVTVAGNLKNMFRHITPANDLKFKSSTNAPTVRIDGLTIAGE
jgi:PmbA protein